MKQNKRHIIHAVLAVIFLLTMLAVPAAAEEAVTPANEEIMTPAAEETMPADAESADAETTPAAFPGEDRIGHSWSQIIQNVNTFVGDFNAEANSTINNKTLKDGSSYTEASIAKVPEGTAFSDHYYYLVNDKMVAYVQKTAIPENAGMTVDDVLARLKETYGPTLPLNTASLNSALTEMVSDQVTYQDGLPSWKKQGFTYIFTSDEESHSIILSLITDAATSSVKMSGLSGTEDLTQEEITQVNNYIDFLQAQNTNQVNAFIAFLKSRR